MIPTEPIGSIPRPKALQDGMQAAASGQISHAELEMLFDDALRDTLRRFDETGSPVVTDGEQRKPSFATYPIAGLTDLAPDGVTIPFADGHTRQLPVITTGPFRYVTKAWSYLDGARSMTDAQLKQGVISASALSLLYPQDGIDGISARGVPRRPGRRGGLGDPRLHRAWRDRADRFHRGTSVAQARSIEGAARFVRRSEQPRPRPAHRCRSEAGSASTPAPVATTTRPTAPTSTTRSCLPGLFRLHVDTFYVQLASETDRERVLRILGDHATGNRRIFVGVTDPIDPRVETPEEVRDRVLEAARFIEPGHLGTTDDCGFSPFGDDTSTSRDTAFAKIQARVTGTAMASSELGI